MIKSTLLSIGVACALSFSLPASATIIADFTGTNNTSAGLSVTNNGVTASGYSWDGSSWNATDLWYRNQTNDHGLGVCSEGSSACATQGGNVNELSNQANFEAILLDKGSYTLWEELWVSSLDSQEVATFYWGNSSSLEDLIAGSFATVPSGSFGSTVEVDILTLTALNLFDVSAQYVLFTPGTGVELKTTGDDNDYLVWKAAVSSVPEPSVIALMGLGLAGIGFVRRKKTS